MPGAGAQRARSEISKSPMATTRWSGACRSRLPPGKAWRCSAPTVRARAPSSTLSAVCSRPRQAKFASTEPIQARAGVRFAFWGAEERGLIGSRHHVASLSEEMRRHIALYINLDMVASPNFARFVQGAAATGDGLAAVVRDELLAEFREHNLSVEERAEGRFGSDGASFSQKGIPTMGLYTGAGGPKSEIQASLLAVRLVALTIPAIIGPVTLSRIS